MDGDSGLVEELEVFLEGSDVLYGTLPSTVVPDGHFEVTHLFFSFFFFQRWYIILTPIHSINQNQHDGPAHIFETMS